MLGYSHRFLESSYGTGKSSYYFEKNSCRFGKTWEVSKIVISTATSIGLSEILIIERGYPVYPMVPLSYIELFFIRYSNVYKYIYIGKWVPTPSKGTHFHIEQAVAIEIQIIIYQRFMNYKKLVLYLLSFRRLLHLWYVKLGHKLVFTA